MSIIALDVGNKKIGVAVSFSNLQAKSLKTVARNNFNEILKIVQDLKVSRIIVGEPRNSQGQLTAQTRATQQFINQLGDKLKKAGIEARVILQDERLSSFTAKQTLKGESSKKRKAKIHSLSAQVILESYLSKLNRSSHEI